MHQTGTADCSAVSEAYRREGFTADVVPFIEDMAGAYRRAHLVISRAGATTLAELMMHGKASILIPYPWVSDNHQQYNALFLVSRGAATIIDPTQLSAATLAEAILRLYRTPDELAAMGEKEGRLARPQAARDIVEHCYALLTEQAE